MSHMPGENSTLPTGAVDEDTPMYNPTNGQHANVTSSTEAHSNFEAAVFQELVESRRLQTQLMEMMLGQFQATSAQTTAHSGTETHSSGHKKLAADPQPFDGTTGKLEEFLSDLTLCFMADPDKFRLPHTKIIYALSYMKGGSAHPWATNVLKEKKDLWPTWEEFEGEGGGAERVE
ncbi:hypothetical protein B0H34DRAFT_676291 [Crassisporium funariophilum]|nr:hypothetical protein B0H34DRAFT_676291 [Crassisporium funariophilum]